MRHSFFVIFCWFFGGGGREYKEQQTVTN